MVEEARMLKASVRIGTIHGRTNYSRKERAFHENDVHPRNLELKRQVKRESRKKILGGGRPPWEQSVHTGQSKCKDRLTHQIGKHDPTVFKFNYRAETLSRPRPRFAAKPDRYNFDQTKLLAAATDVDWEVPRTRRTEEAPVHPALATAPLWDASCTVDAKRREKEGQALCERASRRSRSKNRRLTLNGGYKTPMQCQDMRMEELRAERLHRRLHGNQPPRSAPKPFSAPSNDTPQSEATRRTPSRKYKEYFNDGVFEFSALENSFVWSCSMNPNPEFRGSCYRVRNPDAWNFASP